MPTVTLSARPEVWRKREAETPAAGKFYRGSKRRDFLRYASASLPRSAVTCFDETVGLLQWAFAWFITILM